MKQVCQQWTLDKKGKSIIAGSWFNRRILRRVSIYVTWLFVALGINADAATFLMTVAGFAGIFFCVPHALPMTLLAGICFILFDLLDAVDGEIARWQKSSSSKGLFLDQVSHVLIECPSLGIPALHYYLLSGNDLYLILAATAVVSAMMGRTFREMMFRINAEALTDAPIGTTAESDTMERNGGSFMRFCDHLRIMPLTAFPITKARIVHITTISAILLSYVDSTWLLVAVSWFYAVYCTIRSFAQIPHYYWNRIVDAKHTKPICDYNWPI